MKPRTLAATLVLGLAACLTSAQAQVVPLPCTVLMCMAGTSGVSGVLSSIADPSCAVPIAYWYLPDGTGLAVYDPYFDSFDSYNVRLAFLQSCVPGADVNPGVIAAIMLKHGSAASPSP
jgi:hypothetical protein